MSNLLHLVRFAPKALRNKKAMPLFMEFPVEPEMAPFLVTSSDSVLWMHEPLPNDVIRAAVRKGITKHEIYRESFEAIAQMGREAEWGNVHPFSEKGLEAAVDHLQSYDLTELEILVPRIRRADVLGDAETDIEDDEDEELEEVQYEYRRPAWLERQDFRVCPTSWLSDDTAIILPKEREFVGFIGLIGVGVVMVIHNASRGIGILQG